MIESRNLVWVGERLCCRQRTLFVTVEPDGVYPDMWRVRLPNGALTDIVNRTRARDAAKGILLSVLNTRETATEAAPAHSEAEAADRAS